MTGRSTSRLLLIALGAALVAFVVAGALLSGNGALLASAPFALLLAPLLLGRYVGADALASAGRRRPHRRAPGLLARAVVWLTTVRAGRTGFSRSRTKRAPPVGPAVA
ncbi:MAG: hypothetical protein IRZ32_10920 [Solirubrobacteraceae bacterium]|nr:hypothetical protein [Solirubrobacteraceae bacterium]